jgi:hypothetical protein
MPSDPPFRAGAYRQRQRSQKPDPGGEHRRRRATSRGSAPQSTFPALRYARPILYRNAYHPRPDPLPILYQPSTDPLLVRGDPQLAFASAREPDLSAILRRMARSLQLGAHRKAAQVPGNARNPSTDPLLILYLLDRQLGL